MIKRVPLYKNKKVLVSLVGLFIISIMIFSSLNIFQVQKENNVIKYKNHVFNKQNDQWVTNINNNYIAFKYNPLDVENITIPYYNFFNKMYVIYDPGDIENERFIVQRAMSIFQYSNIRPVLACYKEKDCPDIPIINCSVDDGLYLKYSNDTKVYIDDKCLVVEGTPEQQLMYLDKIFYNLLGI